MVRDSEWWAGILIFFPHSWSRVVMHDHSLLWLATLVTVTRCNFSSFLITHCHSSSRVLTRGNAWSRVITHDHAWLVSFSLNFELFVQLAHSYTAPTCGTLRNNCKLCTLALLYPLDLLLASSVLRGMAIRNLLAHQPPRIYLFHRIRHHVWPCLFRAVPQRAPRSHPQEVLFLGTYEHVSVPAWWKHPYWHTCSL